MRRAARRMTTVVLTALLIGAVPTGVAFAACGKKDLKGTWYMHGVSLGGNTGSAITCQVKIKSNGSIAKGSKCFGENVSDMGEFSVTNRKTDSGGSLKIKSNCNVTGKLNVIIDEEVEEDGLTIRITGTNTVTIRSAQLNKDKQIITGIARDVLDATSRVVGAPGGVVDLSGNSVDYITFVKK